MLNKDDRGKNAGSRFSRLKIYFLAVVSIYTLAMIILSGNYHEIIYSVGKVPATIVLSLGPLSGFIVCAMIAIHWIKAYRGVESRGKRLGIYISTIIFCLLIALDFLLHSARLLIAMIGANL